MEPPQDPHKEHERRQLRRRDEEVVAGADEDGGDDYEGALNGIGGLWGSRLVLWSLFLLF